jgi:hypothetical protein
MLVVGSRGVGGFAAMVLGSVSRYAATHASCPVVVVREAAESARRQVGIGIGDLENTASPTFAFEEAALRQASLIAIHSWHLPDPDISRAGLAFPGPAGYAAETETAKRLEQLLDDWRAKYPTFRSARTSSTATRAGRWPACPHAPTWSSSAGAPARTAPAPSPTRS